jgi:hypothetical protein
VCFVVAIPENTIDSTAKRLKTEFLRKLLSGGFGKSSEKLGFCSELTIVHVGVLVSVDRYSDKSLPLLGVMPYVLPVTIDAEID